MSFNNNHSGLLIPNETKPEIIYLYGGDVLLGFSAFYDQIHKPLSLIICTFGIVTNFVNLIVLSRPHMRTPINVILTSLSAAQLLLLFNYLSLLLFNHLTENCIFPELLQSYGWTVYKWANVSASVSFHTTAMAHILYFSLYRFLSIKTPHYAKVNFTLTNTRLWVIGLHLATPVICGPVYFTTSITELTENEEEMCSLKRYFELRYWPSPVLFYITLWVYGVVFKLVPSLTICLVSFYLIKSLKSVHRRSASLTRKQNVKRSKFRRKFTKMLIGISLLCAAVELPHGVVNTLMGIYGPQFGREVYDNLGDVFEMLTLLYSSVTFVMFCLMDKSYMKTFKAIIRGQHCGSSYSMASKNSDMLEHSEFTSSIKSKPSCTTTIYETAEYSVLIVPDVIERSTILQNYNTKENVDDGDCVYV